MRKPAVVLTALLAVLVGCGQEAADDVGAVCTAMGGADIVGVDVTADVAPVDDLQLTLCVGGRCRDEQVHLAVGSKTVDDGCDGDVCSAHSVDDGTQFSFLTAPLTEKPMTVSGSYRRGGRTVLLEPTRIETVASYPNGRDCGMDGYQTAVTVGASGLSGRG